MQLRMAVDGAPSFAWLEGVLAAERENLTRVMADRHQMLLADLQEQLAELERAGEGQDALQAEKPKTGMPAGAEDVDRMPGSIGDRGGSDAGGILPPTAQSRPPRPRGPLAPLHRTESDGPSKQPGVPRSLPTPSEARACQDSPRSPSSPLASAQAPRSAWDKGAQGGQCLPNAVDSDGEQNKVALREKGAMLSPVPAVTDSHESKGLTELKQEMMLTGPRFDAESMSAKAVDHPVFEVTVAALIMCNAVVISFQIQYEGTGLGNYLGYRWYSDSKEEVWPGGAAAIDVLDYVFGVIFIVEIIVKVLSQKVQWLRDPWNYFDAAIVSLWLMEKPLSDTVKLPADATILRTARLFRVLRLVKVLRTVRGFDSLYLLLTTLKGSLVVLGWACAIIFVTQMLIAMLFWFVLNESYFKNEYYPLEERREVFAYFGTWSRAMLTMFEMTLANWPPVCRLLVEKVSEWFSVFCVFHKLTMGFAVVGVINGVFMQETFKVAAIDDKIMVHQREREVKVHVSKMNRLFRAVDESGDHLIDIVEFKSMMKDEEILLWLSSMEITVRDPVVLFAMLDHSGDGQLTCEEFVRGALALRGGAKCVDVLELRAQIRMLQRELGMDGSWMPQPLYQRKSSSQQLGQIAVDHAPARDGGASRSLATSSSTTTGALAK